MGKTSISWTDAVWNPTRGCTRVSPGCKNCYAEKIAARFSEPGQPFAGFADRSPARWTRKVALIPEKLAEPLRWRESRKVFVDSMSDLFHPGLKDTDIAAVFGVMASARHVTFQVLTKRHERMRDWFGWIGGRGDELKLILDHADEALLAAGFSALSMPRLDYGAAWPLPNVHLGVSVEDQERADERQESLFATPAAVRFLSVEPMLEEIDLRLGRDCLDRWSAAPRPDWVIVGGESGPGRRPCEVEWFESVRRQCRDAGVAFWMKQDAGPRPGMQGRIPDELWAVKEFPEVGRG